MRRVVGYILAAVCSFSEVAVADVTPAAEAGSTSVRELIALGIARRKAEDDEGARAAFERAWRLSQSPEALAQLALSEQALGLWVDAHEHLRLALARSEDAWIARHRPTLQAALAEMESRLGRLEVACNVAGAVVSMDRREVGRTPLLAPLYVPAGRSVVEISAEGYFDVTRQVQIDAGALSRLNITLTPRAPEHVPPLGGAAEPAGAALSTSASRPSASDGPSARDLLRYGSWGLGAMGVAVGVTGYVMREINVSHYNDDARCSLEQGRRRSEECPDAAAGWRLGEGLAIGGFAAAGVFGALGLYLTLSGGEERDVASTECGLTLVHLTCSGSF